MKKITGKRTVRKKTVRKKIQMILKRFNFEGYGLNFKTQFKFFEDGTAVVVARRPLNKNIPDLVRLSFERFFKSHGESQKIRRSLIWW